MTRIVNPLTGRTVFGPETGHTVTRIDPPDWALPGHEVWVSISPSFRPGLDRDLASYLPDWVV